MTTFAYTITLNDSEMITLKAALAAYEKQCKAAYGKECEEQEVKDNPRRAYWAYGKRIEDIREKLHSNVVQTSGNNFAWVFHPQGEVSDATQMGAELADKALFLMQTEGLDREGAAKYTATQIVRLADRLTAAGETSEGVATWTERVMEAYGANLEERA